MRQREARHPVNTAVAIDVGDRRGRVGVTRNVSATGMLFHSASRFSVGDLLSLRFRAAPFMAAEGRVDAVVVRTEKAPLETQAALPFVTAVQFQRRVDEIAAR